MKRPKKNRVRLSLGTLMVLAVLLVLQLIVMPLPADDPIAAASAYAQGAALWEHPSSQPGAGPRLWRQAAIGLGLILLVGSAGVWWYVERRVFSPLADMTGVVAAMSEGHLDQTLDTDAGTELDQLADLINTFSVNQQEGLLFAWNQAGSSLQCLQNLENHAEQAQRLTVDHREEALAAIMREAQRTRAYLEGIQELVRTYYLYDVCLEDQKALAAEDADPHAPC